MWSTHATRRPVAYTGLHARQPHKAVILHTNGGGTDRGSLFGWWSSVASKGQHLGAQIQIGWSICEQYADTAEVLYHAYGASEWAVGIETEDDGDPSKPWNDYQLRTIIAICRELGVPGKLLADGPSDGVGWHEQYADWNKDGHRCPGSVRERQIHDVILPALATQPLSVPFWWHRALREGMAGADVLACKHRLWRLGYHHLTFSASFGPGLAASVRAFQGGHHLPATGVVDRATAHAIRTA